MTDLTDRAHEITIRRAAEAAERLTEATGADLTADPASEASQGVRPSTGRTATKSTQTTEGDPMSKQAHRAAMRTLAEEQLAVLYEIRDVQRANLDVTVACICGSTRQRQDMVDLNRRLTMEGKIVLAPGVFGHDGDPLTEDEKVALDALHFRKIDMADEVHFIAKPNGTFGESTTREYDYAKSAGKRVVNHHASEPEPETVTVTLSREVVDFDLRHHADLARRPGHCHYLTANVLDALADALEADR